MKHVVYGMTRRSLTMFLLVETMVEAVRRDILDKEVWLRQLQLHLNSARTRMKNTE